MDELPFKKEKKSDKSFIGKLIHLGRFSNDFFFFPNIVFDSKLKILDKSLLKFWFVSGIRGRGAARLSWELKPQMYKDSTEYT